MTWLVVKRKLQHKLKVTIHIRICKVGHILHQRNSTFTRHSKTGKIWLRCLVCHAERQRKFRMKLVDITGEISAETDLAYRFFDGKIFVWLPKSQCQWDIDDKIMTMPEWLAIEKELV
jgi:hypothetical protein